MTPTTHRLSPVALALTAVSAVVAVIATHAAVLSFGLRYDDYMMLVPFNGEHARQVLTGSWGPAGFQDAYYRPLTALYLGGLFDIFGLHAWPLHLMSLIELALVVTLIAVFLWRDAGPRAAAAGALAYVVHPVLPDSTSAWILNQMHLLALVTVLGALIVWQSRRHDPRPRAWLPIVALSVLGFFLKEDTVIVLPAILLLQWCRARFVKDVPGVTVHMVAMVGAVALALALLRLWLFPHFDVFEPGPHRPWREIATIAVYGPLRSAALMFEDASFVAGATAFVLLLQASGALRALRRPGSAEGWLWIQGAVLLACFALPVAFAYDIKSTRLHLEVLASALMMGAGAMAIASWCAARPARRVWGTGAAAVMLAGTVELAAVQHAALIGRFAPCSGEDLWFDQDTRAWSVINDDLKRWIDIKAVACEAGRYAPLDQTMDVVQWARGTGRVLLVNRGARSVSFQLQSRSLTDDVQTARVSVDNVEHVVPLRPNALTTVTFRLADDWRVRARGAHRVDVDMDDDGEVIVASVHTEWKMTPQ